MLHTKSTTIITTEPWFIPVDILIILCTFFAVALAIAFLFIIICDKKCHTVPMMLIANSCLAEFAFGSDMLSMAIFTLHNDLKQIQYQDSFCIFRGYLGYVVTNLQNYSYLLQAVYRYMCIMYPTRLFYQSAKFELFVICSVWIYGFVCPLPLLLTNVIIYNVDNQICQMPFEFSYLMIYIAIFLYIAPISLIILIYFKLVLYVREMRKTLTGINSLIHVQKDLRMVRRIFILVIGVATIGFLYTFLALMSFITNPPRYHFRIGYIFVDVSLAFVMILLYQFTEPVKTSVMKKVYWQTNTMIPTFI